MSSRWIQSSERILEQIRKLKRKEDKDRLDHVRSICFALSGLHRSLLGWLQWGNNPDIMSKFTKEDLEEMNGKLSEFAQSFIGYDLEITEKGAEKRLRERKKVERGREEGKRTFYV